MLLPSPKPSRQVLELVSYQDNSTGKHEGMTVWKNGLPIHTWPKHGDNTQAMLAFIFSTWYMKGRWPDYE